MTPGKTVLIADDDRDLVKLLERRCHLLGLDVVTASDAITALKKMDAVPPDLAILDVGMPSGNGLSVREMMAENERLSAVPVVILTGKTDEQTIRRCHSLCAYYVSKCPDVWSRIEPLVRELLNLKPGKSIPHEMPDSLPAQNRPEQGSKTIDAVFTLLGWDESYLKEAGGTKSPEKTIDRPWVLCIDDDADLSYALKLRLENRGLQVVRAFAGMEGYRNACMTPAQAIILDYEMPDGNGDYVLGRLKESPLTRDIPVIVLTGRRERSLQRKMMNLGAAAFLNKPCDFDKLWSVLSPLLNCDANAVECLAQ
jgi:DNA-binding response OmpR family regulator